MGHDDKNLIMALDDVNMPDGLMDNAEEVETYNIPVDMGAEMKAKEMTLAMDNDSRHDEDVEEKDAPYYDEQLEDQSIPRYKPTQKDGPDKVMKRYHKQQQKQRTVCMKQERLERTDRVKWRFATLCSTHCRQLITFTFIVSSFSSLWNRE
jgi:hypothetical protein